MALKPSKTFLIEGRALLVMALPIFIAQLAQMGTGVVDTIMAGRYSSVDLAAIAIGYNIWLPLYLFFVGAMLATTAIVAQDYGAGRIQRIKDILPQSLWLALLMGVIAAPLCYFAAPLLNALDLGQETQTKTLNYIQAVAFGMPAAAVFQALRCHTQGVGVMKPFAIASVIGFLANIPLNYAFIYGKWGAPEMGAAGCGWATAISMWLGPVLIVLYMARAESLKPYLPPLAFVKPRWAMLMEISRLGLPIGLTFFLEIAVFSIIGLCIARMGTTAMASHQIALNVWDVVYMPLISIGTAMTTRIGHAIGAHDKPATLLTIRCGTAITLLVGCAIVFILESAPVLIARAYTDDSDILLMAITLIRLAGLFILLDAVHVIASFSLRAFKDNQFPFLVMCVAYWMLALPLGYYLGIVVADNPTDGTIGFWKGMIAGIAVASTLVLWRLRRWMRSPLPRFEDDPQQPSFQ
ncbi:MAG: MATE family efflux transporter [Halioglobus sp.]